MKKLICITIALTAWFTLAAAEKPRTFVGVITDTMCGGDHSHMGITPDARCVVECVKMGNESKYALYDGKNLYTLSDQQTPEKFAAQKVKVIGVLHEKTKIIRVEKIEPAK